jgi:predicted RNase H-like HicB family nuclease
VEVSKYIVYLAPADEGGYIVSCPHFQGCVTQGETVEEALEMVKDAIKGYIFSLKQHGEPVPPGVGKIIEKIEVVEV